MEARRLRRERRSLVREASAANIPTIPIAEAAHVTYNAVVKHAQNRAAKQRFAPVAQSPTPFPLRPRQPKLDSDAV